MALPINTAFTNLVTVIGQPWMQGANDWINGAYGVLGATYTQAAFRVALAAAPAVGDAAQAFLVANSTAATQQAVPRAQADTLYANFPTGTRLVFAQAAAPTGWTQSADNDRVLRVVNTAGNGIGGTLSITNPNVGDTSITGAQLPPHTHTGSGSTGVESVAHTHTALDGSGFQTTAAGASYGSTVTGASSATTTSGQNVNHTHTYSFTTSNGPGTSATHTHTLSVKYQDVIICSKN